MKLIIVLAVVALAAARPDDDFSRYENFDVDEVITNDRLLIAYCDCFLGSGKCTPEGNDIKDWIKPSIEDNCGKCSEHQKALVAKFLIGIKEKLPEKWEQLAQLYNPDGKYDANIKDFIEKYGQ